MTARSQTAVAAGALMTARSQSAAAAGALDTRDWRDKLTLDDLILDEQSPEGLDAARATFLSLLAGNREKASKRGVDLYWSFVPDGGAVAYKRNIGCFIHCPSEVTVFAYLYEPTVVHAFGRCDCRNSNDNCNHT